tara:strand:- start:1358 stop:2374 length:1017 start_codon:yes stop_codon:yes gene_type:complete
MLNNAFIISIILSLFCIYIFVNKRLLISKYLKVIDSPKKNKIHNVNTPLIGSYAIVVSILIILCIFDFQQKKEMILIFVSSIAFFIVGYFDDRYGINAYIKLIIFILILSLLFNQTDIFIIKKLYFQSIDVDIVLNNHLRNFVSILCILLFVNALNLFDGINGLASGFSGLCILFLSIISSGQLSMIFFTISLLILINTYFIIKGNFFLGDSGTLFFGSLISLITIYVYNDLSINYFVIPVEQIFILFMIPGFDMFRLFIIRIKNKKDPFIGDLDHLHHKLLTKFGLNKTLSIFFLLFLITNFFSYFEILNKSYIIFIYLIIYIFLISFFKKKLKNSS